MLGLTEIKPGKVLLINAEPYVVVKADHHKMGRGGAVLKTKLKNIISGNVVERTWQGADRAEEAAVEYRKANFLYKDAHDAYLMDNTNYEQVSIGLDLIEEQLKFLKEETEVDVLYFQDKPMGIKLPIKVDLLVTMAPPGVRGNSAGNVMKTVELETGAELQVPMFIESGDLIRINTDSGEYVQRA